ncbi:hypothetical protein LCGC14_1102560, partial [marine sediment metagenome]
MPKTTAVVKFDPEDVTDLDTVVEEYSLGKLAGLTPFQQTFRLGQGIQKLKTMITSAMMKPIMDLQGTALGFRTDKDNEGGYDEETVKACLIEATLRGVRPIGNEFNIIARRSYITREGMTRLVREFPGLSNLTMDFGVPRVSGSNAGAVVQATAKWNLEDTSHELTSHELTCEIPVRVNKGMGTDAILGKAERKLLARVYKRITGSITISDGDVSDMATAAPQIANKGTAAVKAQLMGPGAKAEEPPAAITPGDEPPLVNSFPNETRSSSAMPPSEEGARREPTTTAPSPAEEIAEHAQSRGAPSRGELEKKIIQHC